MSAATPTIKDKVGAIAHLDLAEDESIDITVGLFKLTIKRNDVGISVDVYPDDISLSDEPIASIFVYDEDVV